MGSGTWWHELAALRKNLPGPRYLRWLAHATAHCHPCYHSYTTIFSALAEWKLAQVCVCEMGITSPVPSVDAALLIESCHSPYITSYKSITAPEWQQSVPVKLYKQWKHQQRSCFCTYVSPTLAPWGMFWAWLFSSAGTILGGCGLNALADAWYCEALGTVTTKLTV